MLSVQTLEWDQNLGGYYQYDFNGFIMQWVLVFRSEFVSRC